MTSSLAPFRSAPKCSLIIKVFSDHPIKMVAPLLQLSISPLP